MFNDLKKWVDWTMWIEIWIVLSIKKLRNCQYITNVLDINILAVNYQHYWKTHILDLRIR